MTHARWTKTDKSDNRFKYYECLKRIGHDVTIENDITDIRYWDIKMYRNTGPLTPPPPLGISIKVCKHIFCKFNLNKLNSPPSRTITGLNACQKMIKITTPQAILNDFWALDIFGLWFPKQNRRKRTSINFFGQLKPLNYKYITTFFFCSSTMF